MLRRNGSPCTDSSTRQSIAAHASPSTLIPSGTLSQSGRQGSAEMRTERLCPRWGRSPNSSHLNVSGKRRQIGTSSHAGTNAARTVAPASRRSSSARRHCRSSTAISDAPVCAFVEISDRAEPRRVVSPNGRLAFQSSSTVWAALGVITNYPTCSGPLQVLRRIRAFEGPVPTGRAPVPPGDRGQSHRR